MVWAALGNKSFYKATTQDSGKLMLVSASGLFALFAEVRLNIHRLG